MEEFEDWRVDVPFGPGLLETMLCCPEDRKCARADCMTGKRLCEQCEVPVCRDCECDLGRGPRPRMPIRALSNDLMIFYAPRILYAKKVTIMEMICASVCLTTMITFTLEKKYRAQQRLFDSTVHMHRHTVGARGNATSFPMPWADILRLLKDVDDNQASGRDAADLPHTGDELAHWVQILLKTSGAEELNASLIHQATVRGDVVVELIEELKKRGHRAYKDIDMRKVRAKASQAFPGTEPRVPPEIVHLTALRPDDDAMDRIQSQKAATPVPGRAQSDDAIKKQFQVISPNAVVMERSNLDGQDINTQKVVALNNLASQLEGPRPGAKPLRSRTDRHQMKKRPASTHLAADSGASSSGPPAQAAPQCSSGPPANSGPSRPQRVAVSTGNAMLDQYEPWYFGVAFAFMFSFCTGMPDPPEFQNKERFRRSGTAPRVEHALWDSVMARRIEGQCIRDWQLGFVSWNCIFKSVVNLSRTLWSYATVVEKGQKRQVSAKDLECGAIQIAKALQGTYVDPTCPGRRLPVKGDLTKLKFVPGMSAVAKRIMQNAEATTQKMSGTQETRRQMRFDMTAMRVKYGLTIFVTFSPDEKNDLLLLRMSRTRRKDPVLLEDIVAQKYCTRDMPKLGRRSYKLAKDDEVFLALSNDDLLEYLPSYDGRRALIAKDSLASVDGFKLRVLLAYEHLFGMRVCWNCPHCNHADDMNPCQDLFGSNATPEGAVFGRMDAGASSFEAQKSTGSLHAHSNLHIQCLHQHTPLVELLPVFKERPELIARYLNYKRHVCRQEYYSDALARSWDNGEVDKPAGRRKEVEAEWPEYRNETSFMETPEYLRARDSAQEDRFKAGKKWLRQYLKEHVQRIQELKQHHVHVWDDDKQEYIVLDHCRGKDRKKNECKSFFPRVSWLIAQPVVLCQGLIKRMGMQLSGRRCALGGLHGPMNTPNLNGSHPAMLAAQACNSDVQLPYRLPVCEATHNDELCDSRKSCLESVDEKKMIEACQISQDAQAGYACDYTCKRQPCGCNEVREACRGHQKLGQAMEHEPIQRVGKRHMGRVLSDAYSKGIVRSAVENRNLRAHRRAHDVVVSVLFMTNIYIRYII